MVAPAALALKPRHTSLEDAAEQELPELALHELRHNRHPRAVAGRRHRAQERLQMLGDDLMQHGVLGVSGAIRGRATFHASGVARPRGPAYAARWIRRLRPGPAR